MTLLPLALLAALSTTSVGSTSALDMPPPPAGMKVLPEEKKRELLKAAAEANEEAETSEEVEAESAELEELRALEEVSLDPSAQPSAELLQSVSRLGLGSPLRWRMQDALREPSLVEDAPAPPELPVVTDLANFDISQFEERYDIPVEMQPLVAQYIRFFQGPGRRWFRKWMERSTRYLPLMQPILKQRGLPQDTVYLAMIESGFSSSAYSWAHASGPWQFISSTGKQYGLKQDFWVDERRDPVKATHAAARYLADLYREMGHWYLAWAGYNTGGRRVRRTMQRKATTDWWVISDGKGLAKETKHYVPKLIACALVAKHPKAFGFDEAEFDFLEPFEFEEVALTDAVDLEVLARAANVTVDELKDLNPELKRWCTPPATEARPYKLRLPVGTREQFAQNFAKVAPRERLTFKIHKVRKGDTLSRIAQLYASAPEAILQLNRIRNARALKVNAELAIPIPSRRALKTGVPDAAIVRQVAKARRSGVVASRPEEEIPAGTPSRPLLTGSIRTEQIGERTRVTYGVASGDTLWALSQRFNVSVEDLRRWNKLPRRTRGLQVGKVLEIWQGAQAAHDHAGTVIAAKATTAAPGRKLTHELSEGETLWSVAQRYGVSVDDLKRWNRIRNHRAIKAGTELTVVSP